MADEDECYCDHPIRKGERLWLCGTELCEKVKYMMLDKLKTVNGYHPESGSVILSISDEEKD